MAQKLLAFLLLDNFNHFPTATPDEIHHVEQRDAEHPLYAYAAGRWAYYAYNEWEDQAIVESAKLLFAPTKTANFASFAADLFTKFKDPERGAKSLGYRFELSSAAGEDVIYRTLIVRDPSFTPLHLAALMSLPSICSCLLEHHSSVDAKSPIGTPIQCAVAGPLSLIDCIYVEVYVRDWIEQFMGPSRSENLSIQTIDCLCKAGADLSLSSNGPEPCRGLLQVAFAVTYSILDFSRASYLISQGISLVEADLEAFSAVMSNYEVTAGLIPPKMEESLKRFVLPLSGMIDVSAIHWQLCRQAWDLSVARQLAFALDSTPSGIDPRIEFTTKTLRQRVASNVENGEFNKLERLLKDPKSRLVGLVDCNGRSLMHLALESSCGNLQTVKVLLSNGWSVSKLNVNGETPLHCWTSYWGKTANDEDSDSSTNGGGNSDNTGEDEALIKTFIAHGATAVPRDENGNSIFHIWSDMPKRLRTFLKYDTDENISQALVAPNHDGYAPLSQALRLGHDESSLLLLHEGRKRQLDIWQSPIPVLLLAATGGCENAFRTMWKAGMRTSDKTTPVHYFGPRTSQNFVAYLNGLYPEACGLRIDGHLPVDNYLWKCFCQDRKDVSPVSSAVLEELVRPLLSLETSTHEGWLIWKYFASTIMQRMKQELRYHPDYIVTVATVIGCFRNLGILAAYETISQRSVVPSIFEDSLSSTQEYKFLSDLWPISTGLLLNILKATREKLQIWNEPWVIQLLKTCVRSGEFEHVKFLLSKRVSVYQQVGRSSVLETACQS